MRGLGRINVTRARDFESVLFATAQREKRTRKTHLASARVRHFRANATLDERIWRSFCRLKDRDRDASPECVGSFTRWRSFDESRSHKTPIASRVLIQKTTARRALTNRDADDRGRRDSGGASSRFLGS
jgi:hypothetical protein